MLGKGSPLRFQLWSSMNSGVAVSSMEAVSRAEGTGGNPNLGEQEAEESQEAIANALKDSDLVFIKAGMGGGTGSGAAPVVAQISKEAGYLIVGVGTYPSSSDGRSLQALEALEKLEKSVDTFIVIPNGTFVMSDLLPELQNLVGIFINSTEVSASELCAKSAIDAQSSEAL